MSKLLTKDVKKIAAAALPILFHLEELNEKIDKKLQHINGTSKELHNLKNSIGITKDEKEQHKIVIHFNKVLARVTKEIQHGNKNSKTSVNTRLGSIDKLLQSKAIAPIVNGDDVENKSFVKTLKFAKEIISDCTKLFADIKQKYALLVTNNGQLEQFAKEEELSNILKTSTAIMKKSTENLASVCAYLHNSPSKKMLKRKQKALEFFNMVKKFVKDSEQLQAFNSSAKVENNKSVKPKEVKPS